MRQGWVCRCREDWLGVGGASRAPGPSETTSPPTPNVAQEFHPSKGHLV